MLINVYSKYACVKLISVKKKEEIRNKKQPISISVFEIIMHFLCVCMDYIIQYNMYVYRRTIIIIIIRRRKKI